MPYQKSGIPLPENPDTTGYRCIALYLPDDDRYLEALAGQVTYLEKWTSWEKRGDNSAAIAGKVWKDANDLTWKHLWTKGLIMTCENVQDLIDIIAGMDATLKANNTALVNAINTLQLTITPYDCIPCEDRIFTIPDPVPDPDPQNPPVGTGEDEWKDFVCRAANYLWYEHVSRGGAEMMLLATTGGGILSVAAASQILYATGIGAPIAFIGTIIVAIGAIAFIFDQTEFENWLDSLAEGVICAITQSTGTASAIVNVRNYLEQSGAPQEILDYVFAVMTESELNQIFDGSMTIPASFVEPYDCNCIDVPEAAGFLFVPVVYGSPLNAGNNWPNITFSTDGNELVSTYVNVQGSAGGFNGIYIDMVATLAQVGYNPTDNPPVGIYMYNLGSLPNPDTWRVMSLGGSNWNWPPVYPYANQGKQGMAIGSAFWEYPEIEQIKADIAADFGGNGFIVGYQLDYLTINANHNIEGTPFVSRAWIIVEDAS